MCTLGRTWLIEFYANLPLLVLTPQRVTLYVAHVKAASFKKNCRQFCEVPLANPSNLMFSHQPPAQILLHLVSTYC